MKLVCSLSGITKLEFYLHTLLINKYNVLILETNLIYIFKMIFFSFIVKKLTYFKLLQIYTHKTKTKL